MPLNPASTAKISNHPLHPMLIPFPVAFLVGAFVTDLAFIGSGDEFWGRASIWLIGAAIAMALLAAIAGFTDFFSEPRIRSLNDAWLHMAGNLVAVVVAIINFALRMSQGFTAPIKGWGVALSLLVVLILLFTGWKGWEMVYRHRVGVTDAPEQLAPAGSAARSDGRTQRNVA